MKTIWFQEMDPKTLNNQHSSNYNLLLSYRNWAEMPFESKNYNFVIAPLINLKDSISEYFPPLPSEKTNTVKRSTKNMGRDKTQDKIVAKASQYFSAYSVFNHELFQLSFKFLHPTPKDAQNKNYCVHETKLIHNLIFYTFYYTFTRDKAN